MVICNRYNFIFLRIPKNASTSLAAWFVNNCCDGGDKYTQINDAGIRNTNMSQKVLDKHRKHYHFIHMTLQELVNDGVITFQEALTKEVIGVFRNPFHRQLSLFFFLGGDKSPERFREMFKNGCHESDPSNQITQTQYVSLAGSLGANVRVWSYDNINIHLDEFKNRNKIEEKFPLKTYKSNKKPTDMNSLEGVYYDARTREAVREYYKEDFRILGI